MTIRVIKKGVTENGRKFKILAVSKNTKITTIKKYGDWQMHHTLNWDPKTKKYITIVYNWPSKINSAVYDLGERGRFHKIGIKGLKQIAKEHQLTPLQTKRFIKVGMRG